MKDINKGRKEKVIHRGNQRKEGTKEERKKKKAGRQEGRTRRKEGYKGRIYIKEGLKTL